MWTFLLVTVQELYAHHYTAALRADLAQSPNRAIPRQIHVLQRRDIWRSNAYTRPFLPS